MSTKDVRNWTVYDKSLDGREIPWITEGKKTYYVTDMNLHDPAPFFKNMVEEIQKKLPKEMQTPIASVPKEELPEFIDFGEYAQNPHMLYAPDCTYKDGKYYLYFCTSGNLEGVAVSDKPEGAYKDPVQLPCAGIDPAVFIDDDGKAYYYWGQFRASGVELNPDMVSFDEENIVRRIVTDYDLVMKDKSSAVIRYVKIDAPVKSVRVEKDGDGTVEVRIAGKDWREAGNGVAEVELRCTGDAVVRSITIEKG